MVLDPNSASVQVVQFRPFKSDLRITQLLPGTKVALLSGRLGTIQSWSGLTCRTEWVQALDTSGALTSGVHSAHNDVEGDW